MPKAHRASHKPANDSPVSGQRQLDDYGISHSVTTKRGGPDKQSPIDLKDVGLGNGQPGLGNIAKRRTGHRVV